MEKTLLLDARFQPIGIICWQKALSLIFTDKAEVVKEGATFVSSASSRYNIPKVLRLLRRTFNRYRAGFSKRNVFLRDKGLCAYCSTQLSTSSFTLDHIVPKSRGGTNSWLNVVTACKSCNGRK